MDQALTHLGGIALGGYFLWMWIGDYRAAVARHPAKAPLAGAVPCGKPILVAAIVGALVILAIEVGGEYGLDEDQGSKEEGYATHVMLRAGARFPKFG